MPQAARRILDLGCHQGGVGWRLQQDRPAAHLHVTGLDADPAVAERAAARLDAFFLWNLEEPLEAWRDQAWYRLGGYDAIVCADVLEHLRDPWGVVGELRALLAPGGVVVASIPNIRNVANLYDLVVKGRWRYHVHAKDAWRGPQDNVLAWDHVRFFTWESVERLWTDAGYEVVRWGSTGLHAPDLVLWATVLGAQIDRFGGDLAQWRREAQVIQWLTVARVATEG